MRQQMKSIGDNLRMVAVYQLCSWILTVAPKTPEGIAFATAVGDTAIREAKRKGMR